MHHRRVAPLPAFLLSTLLAISAVACGSSDESASPSGSPASTSPGAGGSPIASGVVGGETGTPAGSPGTSPGTGTVEGGGGGGPAGGPPAQQQTSIPSIVQAVSPSVVSVLRGDGGEGSGVIWSSDGIVVTNNHVVENAQGLTIVFVSGEALTADVLATDPRTDLAVIRVDRTGLPAATFREDLPEVGELAIAIGAPLGFETSATAGIVSGLGRAIPGAAQQAPALIDLIQTDAAISPGNSGGALVDEDGRVMGVNVAYIPPGAGAVAIGFAIPAPTVVDAVTQLVRSGVVKHAYLGARIETLTPRIAQAFGLDLDSGAILSGLEPGGPASAAGLQQGDVITSFAGHDIATAEDLLTALRDAAPGDQVDVTVVGQDGSKRTVRVTLGELPPAGQ